MSCAYGVEKVGFVLMAYGATDALCSFSFGFIIKQVGRVPIFLFGMLINGIVIVVLFTWSPHPDQAYVFYILAALWGMADAVWQTQINGEAMRGREKLMGLWRKEGRKQDRNLAAKMHLLMFSSYPLAGKKTVLFHTW